MLLVYFIYQCTKPITINRSTPAFVYIDGNSEGIETSINIDGTFHKPMFREHYFDGKVTIDNTMLNIPTEKENGIYLGALSYTDSDDPRFFTNSALIFFDQNFKNIRIYSLGQWDDRNQQVYVVGPASNIREAKDIQIKMKEKNDSLMMIPK